MTPIHLIRLLPDGAAEWLSLGREGRVLAGPQPGLPREPAERVVVLVPADDVLLLRAPRVARSRRQLEQALPFAIEDQLAAPVEQQHVAFDASAPGDDLVVAVVARTRLEAWLEQLRAAGVEPDRMLAEHQLLPWRDGATLLVEGERALLRHAEAGAFAGRVEEVAGWLDLLAADAGSPARWHVVGPVPPLPAAIALQVEFPGSALPWFAEQLASASGPDLLQGVHAPRRAREGAGRLWRWAAGLAAAALLAGVAQLWLEGRQLQARHAAQRAEMESLLRGAVPGLNRIVDPRAQLAAEQSRLGQGGGAGLLPLLARIAPILAGSGRYTIDALEFRGDTLELVVRGPDVATLDGLREALATLALQVELTSANPGSGGVEGRLRIRSRA